VGRTTLRVQPGTARRRVAGKVGEEWKLAVAAPPVDGKANEACIEFLAELCGASKSAIKLVAGAASRRKIFEIDGRETADIEDRIQNACMSMRQG
jgi:uncharacterized protein (TIGR00251 family)